MMPDDRTADGYDVQMQVNHLSHALLTTLLLPSLEAAAAARGEARAVMHSSGVRFHPSVKKSAWGGQHFEKCPADSLGGNSGTFSMERARDRTRAVRRVGETARSDRPARGWLRVSVSRR